MHSATLETRTRPPGRRRTSPYVACPQSRPELSFVRATQYEHVLRFRDPDAPARLGRPAGASGAQVFMAITERGGAPLSEARYYKTYTRNLIRMHLQPDDAGRVATCYMRWVSARGETGPWGPPCEFVICTQVMR